MKKLEITRATPSYKRLVFHYKKEKDAQMRERYHAIVLMHELKNCTKVARILKRDRSTIQKWVRDFNNGGLRALKPKDRGGTRARLSAGQLEILKKDILTHPRDLGYEFSNWEGKNVSFHVLKKFGVTLGVRACQITLHKLGFTLQRPRYAFPKADPEKQETFKADLKKKWALSTEMA